MYEVESKLQTKSNEPSRTLIGLSEAHKTLDQILDRLQPVIAYKDDAKLAGPEKVQSSVLSEIEGLNNRLQNLLRNIDI